jgi:hypothetical protein
MCTLYDFDTYYKIHKNIHFGSDCTLFIYLCRILTKFCISTCFISVKIVQCTHNIAAMYYRLCMYDTSLQIEFNFGMLFIKIL